MKYIKKFENTEEEKIYWKVSTDPDMYERSLNYLGIPKNNTLYGIDFSENEKYIFICNSFGWSWSLLSEKKWLDDNGYKYMFEINDDVINANKYGI